MDDLKERFDNVAGDTILRGDKGFGRKTNSSAMARLAEGPVTVHHYDDTNESMTIETIQDCSTILEANVRDQNSGHDGYSPSREWRHVARIPSGIVDQFMQKGINLLDQNSLPYLKALLDDPDYSKLRSHTGTISSKPHREFVTAKTRERKN